MNNIHKENISKAFAASLGLQKQAEEQRVVEHFSVFDNNEVFEKFASTKIFEPTEENIKTHLRALVQNELTGIGNYPASCELFAISGSKKNNREEISAAKGNISITIGQKELKLPFIIRDGEFTGFDIMEMDGQRVPYSRENLRKVVLGIEQKNKTGGEPEQEIDSPFLGTAKHLNPATSNGFLGNTLSIRNTVARNQNSTLTSSADSKEVDALLEKVANATKLDDGEFDKIITRLQVDEKQRIHSSLTKIASEMTEPLIKRADELSFLAKENEVFINANTLPNFSLIKFTEKTETSISKTKALIVSEFCDLGEKVKSNYYPQKKIKSIPRKMILTEDNRVYILDPNENFPCVKCTPDDKHFAIHTVSINKLLSGAVFTAFCGTNEHTLIPILKINYRDISSRFIGNTDISSDGIGASDSKNGEQTVVLETEPLTSNEQLKSVLNNKTGDEIVACNRFQINLSGAEEFTADGSHTNTSELTRVIPIKGVLDKMTVTDIKMSRTAVYEEGLALEKTASVNNSLRIFCKDRFQRKYDVSMTYSDKSKKLFKDIKKDYRNIGEDEVEGILSVLNLPISEKKNAILEARNRGLSSVRLPKNLDTSVLSSLSGGNLTNLSKDQVKSTLNKYINPERIFNFTTKTAIAALGAGTAVKGYRNYSESIKDLPDDTHVSFGRKAKGFFTPFTEQKKTAEALSCEFEKLAFEKKSEELLQLAKVATISHNFFGIAEDIIGGEVYLDMPKIAKSVIDSKEIFEKIAGDLYSIKEAEAEKGVALLPNGRISAMIDNMEGLYETACLFYETSK